MLSRVGEMMVLWLPWLGAVGFTIFVAAFMIALLHPRSTLSPEDAAAIQKLIWKDEGEGEKG